MIGNGLVEIMQCPRCATQVAISWPNPKLHGRAGFDPSAMNCHACGRRLKHKEIIARPGADIDAPAKLTAEGETKRKAEKAVRARRP